MKNLSFSGLKTALCVLVVTAALLAEGPLRAADLGGAVSKAEIFFAPIAFSHPQLSPDGTKVCALTLTDPRHYCLTLIEVGSMRSRILVRDTHWNIANFWFKSDELLLLLIEHDNGVRVLETLELRTGALKRVEGLDDKALGLRLVNELPDEPEEALFSTASSGVMSGDIFRINLRTGKLKIIERAPSSVAQWLTNRKGEAIAALAVRDGRLNLLWRPNQTKDWQTLFDDKTDLRDFFPWGVAPDQKRLVRIEYAGHPTGRVCYFDPTTGQSEEVAPSRETEPEIYQRWGRQLEIAALRYRTAEPQVQFLSEEARAADAWLAKALPGTQRSYESFSKDNKVAVVFASTDRNPGIFCLVNFETKKLSAFGASYPAINPTKTVPVRAFGFASKEGPTLSGSLWLPTGVEKPPLVVLAGRSVAGPRGEPAFDFEAQFFASRGVAVARINHRGTEGFGQSFSASGDFQIATGMVDDLSRGIRWLGEQGLIDPKRVGVLGERLGGLVAFQLAAQTPEIRGLVNIGTPLPGDTMLTIQLLSPSGKREEELMAAAGGKKSVRTYIDSLNVPDAAKKISAPSLHFYRADQAIGATGIKTILQERGQACELVIEETGEPRSEPEWVRVALRYEKIAVFFTQNL